MNRILILLITIFPSVVFADELDTGDTAWILVSTALVLFMTLPGLALFYSGLVRAKNVRFLYGGGASLEHEALSLLLLSVRTFLGSLPFHL